MGSCGQIVDPYPQTSTRLSTGLSGVVFDFLDDFRHLVVDVAPLAHLLADFLGRVHNRCVIPIAEVEPNFWQGQVG